MQEKRYTFNLRKVNRHSGDPMSNLPKVYLNMTAQCKTNGLNLSKILCTKQEAKHPAIKQ